MSELVQLTIMPNLAPAPANVYLDAPPYGSTSYTTQIFGALTVDLQPSAHEPTSVQVTEFEFQLGQGIIASVGAFANSTEVALPPVFFEMVDPGQGSGIDDDDLFEQFGNGFDLHGIVDTSSGTLDLADLGTKNIDFDAIITVEDSTVMMDFLLLSQFNFPIEVGALDGEMNILVDSAFIATGVIADTPTSYNYVWGPNGGSTAYDGASNWTDGNGDVPGALDTISFPGNGSVDLGGATHEAVSAVVTGDVVIENGTLLLSESLTVNGELVVGSDVQAASVAAPAGGSLELTAGNVLTVAGELSAAQNSLSIEADEPGSFVLARYGSTNATGPVSVNGEELQFSGVEGHLGAGIFGSVTVGASELSLDSHQAIAGDTDGNGQVEFADFLALSGQFGSANADWTDGDFDGNNQVEFSDFLQLSANFGTTAEVALATVPEPSSYSMALGFGLLALIRRTRRRASN